MMANLSTKGREGVLRILVDNVRKGATKEELRAMLVRNFHYSLETADRLIRESLYLGDVPDVQKRTVSGKGEISRKKGGGEST